MRTQHTRRFSRRRFLGGLTLVGTAGLLGVQARSVAAEPPPETTTLRLINVGGICLAPQYVADDSILKFFQVDSTGMFRMTSSARYFKKGVGSSRPN